MKQRELKEQKEHGRLILFAAVSLVRMLETKTTSHIASRLQT